MTVQISRVSNSQSFSVWLARSNQMADLFTSNVVTVDSTIGGSITTGNSAVNGYLTVSTLSVGSALRGGNNTTSGVLVVSTNTAWTNPSGINVAFVAANSSYSAVYLNPANVSIQPSGNTLVGGSYLNVNATVTNVTSGTINLVGVNTLQGNTTLKAANGTTMISAISNGSFSNLNVTISNTFFSGGNVNMTSNLNASGLGQFTSNVTMTGTLTINTIASTSIPLAMPRSTFASNTVFGANTIIVDTADGQVGIATNTLQPTAKLTVGGQAYVDSIMFSGDSTTITSANIHLTMVNGGNSIIQVVPEQILLTSNNITIGVLDSYSNNINFFSNSIRTGNSTVNSVLTVIGNTSVGGILSVTGNTNLTGTLNSQREVSNSVSDSISTTYSITTTSLQAIDTMLVATYRAADWFVEISNTTNHQVSKAFVVHDGSTPAFTEYALMNTGVSFGTLSADITGGNLRLLITPASAPATVKLVRTGILA